MVVSRNRHIMLAACNVSNITSIFKLLRMLVEIQYQKTLMTMIIDVIRIEEATTT